MRLMNEFGYYFGASLDESHSVREDCPQQLWEQSADINLDRER
jgi:hypothetical protein